MFYNRAASVALGNESNIGWNPFSGLLSCETINNLRQSIRTALAGHVVSRVASVVSSVVASVACYFFFLLLCVVKSQKTLCTLLTLLTLLAFHSRRGEGGGRQLAK